jgi:hypothetical protein
MDQLQLNLLGRIDGAYSVPWDEVEKLTSYREAVRACWLHRRSQRMTQATLCELTGLHPNHIPDYFAESELTEKRHPRRDMPARYVPKFEAVCGNTYVSQWMQLASHQAIAEDQKERAAA